MEKLIAVVVASIICVFIGLILVNQAMNSAARQAGAQANLAYAQGQAEAMVLRAQGQNSLDRAEAAAIRAEAFTAKMLALLPYTVLAILAILGLAVVALAFVIITRRPEVAAWSPPCEPARIIERQIVYLPAEARPALPTPSPVEGGTSESQPPARRVIYL